ncbi:hypothetical protein CEXT_197761, partial [Caerostris extrusa]
NHTSTVGQRTIRQHPKKDYYPDYTLQKMGQERSIEPQTERSVNPLYSTRNEEELTQLGKRMLGQGDKEMEREKKKRILLPPPPLEMARVFWRELRIPFITGTTRGALRPVRGGNAISWRVGVGVEEIAIVKRVPIRIQNNTECAI